MKCIQKSQSLQKSVSTENWIFWLALYTFAYAIVFCLLGFCSSECHSLFMHCMKSYLLLSGINLLSFSSIHCPLSSMLASMERKALNMSSSLEYSFFYFFGISPLAHFLLEMSNPWAIHVFLFFLKWYFP